MMREIKKNILYPDEITLNQARETVGYLYEKSKQLKFVNRAQSENFLDRAIAIDLIIKYLLENPQGATK